MEIANQKPKTQEEENTLLENAINEYRNGKNIEASKLFIKIATKNKNNFFAYYGMGLIRLKMQSYGEAYYSLSKAKDIKNQSFHLHKLRSFCLFKLNRFQEALDDIDTALYFLHNCKELAVNNFDQNEKSAYLLKMSILNKQENYNKVLDIYNEIRNKYKNDEDIFMQRLNALCELKDQECSLIFSGNMGRKYQYLNARYLYLIGRNPEAINLVRNGIDGEFDNLDQLYFLNALMEKDKEKKLQSLSKARSINKRYVEAYSESIKILVSMGKFEEAINIINSFPQKNIEEKKAIIDLLVKRLEFLVMQRNLDEAINKFKEIKAILDDDELELLYPHPQISYYIYRFFRYYCIYKGYTWKDLTFSQEDGPFSHGGYCEVYEGELKEEPVAIKKYKRIPKDDKELEFYQLYNIYKECSFMEFFETQKNPHFLKVLCVFYQEEIIYLVTPFCSGGELTGLLADKEAFIPMHSRIQICQQIISAINVMHSFSEPYIHHDIKSLNVLIRRLNFNENIVDVVLCDFGSSNKGRSKNYNCTQAWAAPEFLKMEDYNEKIDIYSFGILMWEIFSRRRPFENVKANLIAKIKNGAKPDINQVESGTPEDIKRLIVSCLETDSKKRPTAKQILEKLVGILNK